ncbi:DDE-type integrase/transposase/recombinase [Nocardioides zeae]|uniref:DDE-type integrase/transposase/recombinase n=1 Tax=Nocardioides zeae TaxID=1457234 RepID=A0A6P0HFR3_9ACTN|nr:DDE-type integrase/transposase/recombinase [Nocardioides zeae]
MTYRVLGLARQPYCRWLAAPVTASDLEEPYRANALFDAHQDDPEFGYRFLVDEAAEAGVAMAQRTAWRICSDSGWWSAFGKPKRSRAKRPGAPAHDDLCAFVDEHGVIRREFTATAPNELWLTDITERKAGEGTLYLCAIKDAHSNRILGYSIDSPMKSRLAVPALNSTVARRAAEGRHKAGRVVRATEAVSSAAGIRPRAQPLRPGRLHGPPRRCGRQRCHGELLRAAAERCPRPPHLDHPWGTPDRDRDLD